MGNLVHTKMALNNLGYPDIHPGWHYLHQKYNINHQETDIYEMFAWCDDNIGEFGVDWDWHIDTFCFRRAKDATIFGLRW